MALRRFETEIIAGTRRSEYTSSKFDLPATEIDLAPDSMAYGLDGALYLVTRGQHVVRRVDPATGIATLAIGSKTGNLVTSPLRDGYPADGCHLWYPSSICCDDDGNLYVADSGHFRIRRVDAETGIITTVAGNGTEGPGPNGAALACPLTGEIDRLRWHNGALYFIESWHTFFEGDFSRTYRKTYRRLRRLSGGTITTLLGGGEPGSTRTYDTTRTPCASLAYDGYPLYDYEIDEVNNRILVSTSNGIPYYSPALPLPWYQWAGQNYDLGVTRTLPLSGGGSFDFLSDSTPIFTRKDGIIYGYGYFSGEYPDFPLLAQLTDWDGTNHTLLGSIVIPTSGAFIIGVIRQIALAPTGKIASALNNIVIRSLRTVQPGDDEGEGDYDEGDEDNPIPPDPDNDDYRGRRRQSLSAPVGVHMGRHHVVYEKRLTVYYRQAGLTGGWSPPVRVSDAGQHAIKPAVAVRGDGALLAVWELPQTGGRQHKISLDGGKAWQPWPS